MWSQIKSLPPSARVALCIMLLWAVYVGGTKPETPPAAARIAQLVLALHGGGIVDPSGVLGSAAQLAAVEMFNDETAAIVAAASNIVAAAQAEYEELAAYLETNDYSVAYIGYDFPRANPYESTNHNITATIVRTSQSGTPGTLDAWVYFSSEPSTNVNVHLQASVADGVWAMLDPITNTWPTAEDVGGLSCYRYAYTIPEAIRGVPLKPASDIAFGGYDPGQYLNVPADGVIVSTNGVDCVPYTGWDLEHPAPFGANLAVRYIGGIAVEAIANGTNYTGIVNQEVTL